MRKAGAMEAGGAASIEADFNRFYSKFVYLFGKTLSCSSFVLKYPIMFVKKRNCKCMTLFFLSFYANVL